MPRLRLSFVNVYLVDQAFGGPEEGGWWYSVGHPERSTPCIDMDELDEAKRSAREFCKEENGERRSDISSVISEGRYEFMVERAPGNPWPLEKPHYE